MAYTDLRRRSIGEFIAAEEIDKGKVSAKPLISFLILNGLQRYSTFLTFVLYPESCIMIGKHGESANYLLREALQRGEFPRGEAGRITNRSERTARDILKSLTESRLLVSDTEKGPVRLGFPVNVLEYYFPLLYSEADLTR